MSGIIGICERQGGPVDRELLRALTDSLTYCGPDARDTWASGSVGFGHTLLRTTRESQHEQQPANLDRRFWITADARIDCQDELRDELTRAGTAPAGRAFADSDLILQAYAVWREECVQHLRGDFCFAIWDAHEKILFCARDHFGVKPFYYAESGDTFLFSNVLDGLRQHPVISANLNEAAIGDFLLFGLNCDETTTAFQDIRRLPAAHSMTVSAEEVRIRRYWSAPTTGHIRYSQPQDYVEHFQIVLQAAVADRLRADRVGILLSGGLDSATMATIARDLAGSAGGAKDLRAYTVVYNSLIKDEEGYFARQIADFLKIPIQFIPMDELKPFERWEQDELHWPEPVDDPFFAGLFDQFGALASDCRVVLSGEGSDNLMHFQMWPHIKDMFRNREWSNLVKQTSRYLRIRPSIVPGIKRRTAKFFENGPGAPTLPKWLSPDFARRLNLKDRAQQWSTLQRLQHPVLPEAHASLALPQWSAMFEWEHAGLTRTPVEVRHPFMDLRVVNFLLALPPFPHFYEKNLLREATVGRLPESVRMRRKTPLRGDPLSKHLQKSGGKSLDEVRYSPEMEAYIDRRMMQSFQKEADTDALRSNIRPLCLNFWLQSMSKVRYNLHAEVRNA